MKNINEYKTIIGSQLRATRKIIKIGTKKASIFSGLTENQILDMELNRRNYTIDSLLKYISVLNIEIDLKTKK
jgi:transcriptional regulator with XRE-family HTH domain